MPMDTPIGLGSGRRRISLRLGFGSAEDQKMTFTIWLAKDFFVTGGFLQGFPGAFCRRPDHGGFLARVGHREIPRLPNTRSNDRNAPF